MKERQFFWIIGCYEDETDKGEPWVYLTSHNKKKKTNTLSSKYAVPNKFRFSCMKDAQAWIDKNLAKWQYKNCYKPVRRKLPIKF